MLKIKYASVVIIFIFLLLFSSPVYADKSQEEWSCRWFNLGCSKYGINSEKVIASDEVVFRGNSDVEIRFVNPKKPNDLKVKDVFVSKDIVSFDSKKYNLNSVLDTKKVVILNSEAILDEQGEIIGYNEYEEIVDTGIIAVLDFGVCPTGESSFKVYRHPDFVNNKELVLSGGEFHGYAYCEDGRILYPVTSFSSYALDRVTLLTGLRHYYTFDEATGIVSRDYKNLMNGTAVDFITPANAERINTLGIDGKIRGSAYFSSSAQRVVRFNSTLVGQWHTGVRTMSFWVKRNSAAGLENIYAEGSNVSDVNYGRIRYGSSQQIIYSYNSGATERVVSTSALSSTNWNHIVIVINNVSLNGLGDAVKIYVNGVLNSSVTTLGTAVDPTIHNPENYLGAWIYNKTTMSGRFGGSVDEFGVWDRVLTEDEILALYNLQAPGFLSGQPPFVNTLLFDAYNAYTGDTISTFNLSVFNQKYRANSGVVEVDWIKDQSGFGKDLTVFGNVAPSSGKILHGVEFDSATNINSNNYFSAAALDNVTDTLTVSYWVYNKGSYGYNTPISRMGGVYTTYASDSLMTFFFYNNSGSLKGNANLISAFPYLYSNWMHMTFVIKNTGGTTSVRVYQNGVNYGNVSVSSENLQIASFLIGKEEGSSVNEMRGTLDEVYFFNRELSDAEITTLYNNGTVDHTGLVRYYPFTRTERGVDYNQIKNSFERKTDGWIFNGSTGYSTTWIADGVYSIEINSSGFLNASNYALRNINASSVSFNYRNPGTGGAGTNYLVGTVYGGNPNVGTSLWSDSGAGVSESFVNVSIPANISTLYFIIYPTSGSRSMFIDNVTFTLRDSANVSANVSSSAYLTSNSFNINTSNLYYSSSLIESLITLQARKKVSGSLIQEKYDAVKNSFESNFDGWQDNSTGTGSVTRTTSWASDGNYSVGLFSTQSVSNKGAISKVINSNSLTFDYNSNSYGQLYVFKNVINASMFPPSTTMLATALGSVTNYTVYFDPGDTIIFQTWWGLALSNGTSYLDNIRYNVSLVIINGTEFLLNTSSTIASGNYLAQFNASNYFPKNHSFNMTSLQIKTETIENISNNNHTVNLKGYGSFPFNLNNYNITVRSGTFNETYSGSVSNQTSFYLEQGLNYNVSVSSDLHYSTSAMSGVLNSMQTSQDVILWESVLNINFTSFITGDLVPNVAVNLTYIDTGDSEIFLLSSGADTLYLPAGNYSIYATSFLYDPFEANITLSALNSTSINYVLTRQYLAQIVREKTGENFSFLKSNQSIEGNGTLINQTQFTQQNIPNSYSCTGNWSIDNDCGDAVDGVAATYGVGAPTGYLEMNFTKPVDALNISNFEIREDLFTYKNYSMENYSACWNAYPTRVRLRVESNVTSGNTTISCHNSTAWITMDIISNGGLFWVGRMNWAKVVQVIDPTFIDQLEFMDIEYRVFCENKIVTGIVDKDNPFISGVDCLYSYWFLKANYDQNTYYRTMIPDRYDFEPKLFMLDLTQDEAVELIIKISDLSGGFTGAKAIVYKYIGLERYAVIEQFFDLENKVTLWLHKHEPYTFCIKLANGREICYGDIIADAPGFKYLTVPEIGYGDIESGYFEDIRWYYGAEKMNGTVSFEYVDKATSGFNSLSWIVYERDNYANPVYAQIVYNNTYAYFNVSGLNHKKEYWSELVINHKEYREIIERRPVWYASATIFEGFGTTVTLPSGELVNMTSELIKFAIAILTVIILLFIFSQSNADAGMIVALVVLWVFASVGWLQYPLRLAELNLGPAFGTDFVKAIILVIGIVATIIGVQMWKRSRRTEI